MFKHTISTTYSTDAGIIVQVPETITGSTSRDIDSVLVPTGTNSWNPIPLVGDVTKLNVTNNGPVEATVKIRVLTN
jgi:hypothetical protein